MGGGGWGKKQKKIHARDNAKKKNSCKEEGKEKKFMQKDNPIVTFIYIKFARCGCYGVTSLICYVTVITRILRFYCGLR